VTAEGKFIAGGLQGFLY